MKALSLYQPWATLIACGAKGIETRSWAPSSLRLGEKVAIHAAKRWTASERQKAIYDPLIARALVHAAERGLWQNDTPTLGCVIAIATFAGATRTEDLIRHGSLSLAERWFGDYSLGRWGWHFIDVRPIKPIPLRGQQGLFEWEPSGEVCFLDARGRVVQP